MQTNLKKAVLITGTSSGIGKSIALHLDKMGYKVYAGIRKISDKDALIKLSSNSLQPVILDVTDEKTIISTREFIERDIQNYESFALVNNAGIATGSPVEAMSSSKLRLEMEVNYFGVLAVIRNFLPVLRVKKGRIINISSISGKGSLPFNGTYSASKFALEAVTDALRLELKPWKIHISNILPGDFKTKIWEKASVEIDKDVAEWTPEAIQLYGPTVEFMKDVIRNIKGSDPEIISRTIEKLLRSKTPKTRIYIGNKVWFYYFLEKNSDKIARLADII